MENQIKQIILSFGYEKRQYGYVRDNPRGTSQGITVFDKDPMEDWFTVDMFGWPSGRDDDYKLYTTGVIGVSNVGELAVLLQVFDQYKNIDWL
jgi:hypothetical protein